MTYTPSKQTAQTKTKTYIIPKGKYASLIESYLNNLHLDVNPDPEDPFFFTGRKPLKNGTSKYINSPLGINEMRNTGIYIAKLLQLEEPERYTGNLCFKTTPESYNYLFCNFIFQVTVSEGQVQLGWQIMELQLFN